MVRREFAGRVHSGWIAREVECLAAAPAEINRASFTGSAWLGQPGFASKATECLGMLPDVTERMFHDVLETDIRERVRRVTGKHKPVRADHDVATSPSVHATFRKI